jgi:UDP-glucuronate 4-epimerase
MTKKANELMAYTYSHLYNISTTGLRFFTVYGPWGRPDMAPMLFAKAMLDGEGIKVFNHGNLERDFTYIDDIVNGIYKTMEAVPKLNEDGIRYNIFNIGNSKPIKLLDFITTLEEKFNIKANKILLPMQDGDVLSTYADVTELVEATGYTPSTKLEDGIQKFADWYRNYYIINAK